MNIIGPKIDPWGTSKSISSQEMIYNSHLLTVFDKCEYAL